VAIPQGAGLAFEQTPPALIGFAPGIVALAAIRRRFTFADNAFPMPSGLAKASGRPWRRPAGRRQSTLRTCSSL